MAHQDNAPWVWQAARLIDRLGDDDLTVMDLADALRDEWDRGNKRSVAACFRNADNQDWDHLMHMIPDSGHGKFWKAVFAEVRTALASAPEQKE